MFCRLLAGTYDGNAIGNWEQEYRKKNPVETRPPVAPSSSAVAPSSKN